MSTMQKSVRWGLILLQGAAVALAIGVFLPKVQVSPGQLAAVHARESTLAGPESCVRCHGESRHASMSSACSTCHRDIESQMSRKSGLHGLLPPEVAADCGRCHGEHKGPQFPPVHPRSFALAGIDDVSRFAHDTVEFGLIGKHAGLQCSKCHPHADTAVPPAGVKRYLGLQQTCTHCHKDVHDGAYGPRCQACHGQEKTFPAVAAFRHPEAFPLTGVHGGLACAKCHEPGTINRAMEPGAAIRPTAVRDCAACHRSPHGDEFLSRIGSPLGIASKETCVRCHHPEQGSFLGPLATITRKQHAAVGFPLTPPHHQLSCTACHADYGKPRSGEVLDAYHRRYPGRAPDDCRSCHGDPHRGEFEIGAFKGRDCLSCHTRQAFAPADFDMAKHDAAFKLEGSHRKLQCAQCHTKTEPQGPRDYRGVPVDCRSCHKDPHEGQFNKPVYLGGDCRVCHTQSSWRPSTFTAEMHRKAPFALTGAHLGVGCTTCHGAPPSDANAAVAARKFAGVAGECVSCHADVHAGAFDGPGRPTAVGGDRGCARCHGTDTFRKIAAKDFDHAVWTGFALNGAHSGLECARCHGRSAVPDAKGRTLGLASGTSCQSCHSDPHAGQFGPTQAVNCASCHREAGTFKNLLFDHKNSRFPLDEVHSKVACAKCHVPVPVGDGIKAIRYKPLGTKCGDCHDPRGSR